MTNNDEEGTMTWDDPNTLMERTTAGITVRVAYLPIMAMATLTVATHNDQMAVTVDPAEIMDAFHHPMTFLAPAQIDRLGVA